VDLRQLRYFFTVAEERRFSSAARRLPIAAPSRPQPAAQSYERSLAPPDAAAGRTASFRGTRRQGRLAAEGIGRLGRTAAAAAENLRAM